MDINQLYWYSISFTDQQSFQKSKLLNSKERIYPDVYDDVFILRRINLHKSDFQKEKHL